LADSLAGGTYYADRSVHIERRLPVNSQPTLSVEGDSMADQTSETPVLDLLASMTADSIEASSSLDEKTLILVRIAALVAVDAPPISYLANLRVAGELDVDEEQVRGVLAAIAPIVGTARVASATSKMVRALGLAELEDEIGEADEG
jgi:4-carboxymuconolactone decarboxylase